jgi:hypothetical protein
MSRFHPSPTEIVAGGMAMAAQLSLIGMELDELMEGVFEDD